MSRFVRVDRDTAYLLPPSVQQWLPKDHLARYDSVAFRFVAGNTHPDHDTIATFRGRFADEIKALFVQVLQIARANGLRRRKHSWKPSRPSASGARRRGAAGPGAGDGAPAQDS